MERSLRGKEIPFGKKTELGKNNEQCLFALFPATCVSKLPHRSRNSPIYLKIVEVSTLKLLKSIK